MKQVRWAGKATGVFALACLAVPGAFASHSWNGFHWARASNPLSVGLVDNMTTAEWDGLLGSVSGDWTASSVLDTPVAAGTKGCKAQKGYTVVCNGKFGFSGWLGLAQIWISGDHIFQAVSKVNDTYFNTKTYNKPEAKRHVLCQEIGHTLGLDHQRDAQSCMNDTAGLFDAGYVSPNAHDYEQLETIYNSHNDSSASSALQVAASADEAPDEEGEFGTPAGPNSYVKDLGEGIKLYTLVIPAPTGKGNPDPDEPGNPK